MTRTILSLTWHGQPKTAKLVVRRVTESDDAPMKVRVRRYRLTKRDVLQAGRDLYDAGDEHWMTASSVHHPADFKCRLDVAGLVEAGFRERLEGVEAIKHGLLVKILKAVNTPAFRAGLSVDEAAFLAEEVRLAAKTTRKLRKSSR